jgi:nitrite reductase/ring-hydroxylating ferredoxin subunit
MRVGVIHAIGNLVAAGLYAASLAQHGSRGGSRGGPRSGSGSGFGSGSGRLLRLAGLAVISASGLLGGHISFRLAGGANHAEEVPHLVKPGWQHLMLASDLPEGKLVRQWLGEVPVVAVRMGGTVHVLADRCSHMSGPLSDGELSDGELDGGCLTCPWHGSVFRIADGSVARGPATAPQPAFEVREAGGAIQVCLPGAG